MNDAPEERRRVYKKIAPLILEYASTRMGRMFHAEDLYQNVLYQNPEIAPESPGRILRLLRRQGRLNYIVIDRGDSTYQFLAVEEDNNGQA